MQLPEFSTFIRVNLFIKGILFLCLIERKSLRCVCKQNDSSRKNISGTGIVMSLIVVFLKNLWSHSYSSANIRGLLFTGRKFSETKIGNPKVAIAVKQNVFGFEISMYKTFIMSMFNTIEKLFVKISSMRVTQSTGVQYEIKKAAMTCEL